MFSWKVRVNINILKQQISQLGTFKIIVISGRCRIRHQNRYQTVSFNTLNKNYYDNIAVFNTDNFSNK